MLGFLRSEVPVGENIVALPEPAPKIAANAGE